MSAPAELALGHSPSGREMGLWAAAAVAVVLAHGAAAYVLQSFVPEPPPVEATEQALEIDLTPLAISTPDAVESEVLDEVEPQEMVQPVEEEPLPQQQMAEAVPPETVTPLAPIEPEESDPIRPEALRPVEAEPQQAETVAPDPVQPEPERLAEIAPVVEPEPQMVQPEIVTPVEPEVVLPQPPPPEPKPLPRRERKPVVKEVAKPRPVKRAEPKPVEKAEAARKPPRAAANSKASQKAQASRAPKISSAAWQARVLSRINGKKRYPAAARARGEQGTASVSFSVNASGSISGVRLTKSSGSADLDRAALDMVRRSSPVPAPPPEMGRSRINLSLPVSFSLR